MIDQRYRKVSFSTAISDFFKGSVDYSGFTSRAGHWFPVGLIYLIFAGVYTGIFASVYKKYNSIGFFKNVIGFSDAAELYLRNNSEFASLLYIITGVFILLHIPIAASFCRRLRDVGFTTLFSAILIALYVILAYFYVALITPVYVIVFFFILMSLPANKVETNNNDEFSKFVFRQSFQAQQYYAQFNNQQFDQFGNPISNQQNFNNEMNQGFNPQGQQGFNPNAPHGHQNPGFQGQPQGFNPQGQQEFNPNGQQGRPNPGFQGQSQGFNPQGPQGFNPNGQQGRPNPGFQGQPQGFNPQGQQGFNPNGQQGRPNLGFQGQPQGFNPQGQQGFNPNAQQGRPNPGFQGQPQGFNPQGQPQQNVNPNAPQGEQSQGFNEVGAQAQQAPEVKQEEVVVGEQNVEVVPQVEVTPTAEEVAPQVETTQEVKVEVVGGARSRRLQKLNKAEEEAVFKKRR